MADRRVGLRRGWPATGGEGHGLSIQALIALAIVTGLSLLRTGYEFNIINNGYHIPIVLRFAEMPQFANDPVVQSLDRFVSPVYRLLALVATEGTISLLFFVGLVALHLLTFLGLLRIAVACGIESTRGQVLLLLLLSAAWFTYGYSLVGRDGLLISYFTHTELARAVAILSIVRLLNGGFVQAGALAGLAFSINAFVGIWTLAPLGAVAVAELVGARGAAQRAAQLRVLLLGALAFVAVAAPVAIWIVIATAGQEVTFDYPAYLREVYAHHFFLDAADSWSLRQTAFLALAGALAAGLLRNRRNMLLVLGSLCAVFALGALAGMYVQSRLVLNLHLLRVDGMIRLLCAALVAAVAGMQILRGGLLGVMVAALASFGLIDGRAPVAAAAMALAYAQWLRPAPAWWPAVTSGWPSIPFRAVLAGLLLLGSVQATRAWQMRHAAPEGVPSEEQLRGANPAVRDWLEVQEWARRSTPPAAQFLTPPLLGFRAGAQRRVWTSPDDMSVGMWAPGIQPGLRERRLEVERLNDLASRLAYACAKGIDYVVLDLRKGQGQPFDPGNAVFRNRWFEVHQPRCNAAG